MHGQRFMVKELRYGSDGQSLFLRIDFVDRASPGELAGLELRINIHPQSDPKGIHSLDVGLNASVAGAETAFSKILEARVALTALGMKAGQSVSFQLSLWQGGLPVEALPAQGWIETATAESVDWMM